MASTIVQTAQMDRIKPIILASAMALVGGCGARSDFEKICNAEQLSGVSAEQDPSQRAMKIAKWVSDNIHSRDAIQAMRAMAVVSPADKGRLLKQAAQESGYDGPCPMAEMK